MLINPRDSYLLVVDVQEKLAPNMHQINTVMANIVRLIKSAQIIKIPVLLTEHCADKIGPTVAHLLDLVDADSVMTKTHFSACSEPKIQDRLKSLKRSQVIITGAETHVCVLQTALILRQTGYQPFVVADGTSSRTVENKALGIDRMRQNKIEIVSAEMVIFEWLQRAGDNRFRKILPLIRDA